jgi:thioredoxin 1
MLVRLASRDFMNGKLNRTGMIVVMFYADWCPFCMAFKPIFEDFARKGHLDCGEANISHYEDPLWEQFQLRVVPSILIFEDGKLIKRKDGVLFRGLSEADLDEITSDLRSSDSSVG